MATQLRRKASVSDPVFVEGLAFYRHFSSACTRKEDRFTVFAACQLFSDFGFDPQFVDSFCCFASADEFGCLTQEIFTETYFRVHESVYFNKTPRFPHSSTSEKDSLPQKTDRPELTSRDSAPSPVTVEGVPIESILSDEGDIVKDPPPSKKVLVPPNFIRKPPPMLGSGPGENLRQRRATALGLTTQKEMTKNRASTRNVFDALDNKSQLARLQNVAYNEEHPQKRCARKMRFFSSLEPVVDSEEEESVGQVDVRYSHHQDAHTEANGQLPIRSSSLNLTAFSHLHPEYYESNGSDTSTLSTSETPKNSETEKLSLLPKIDSVEDGNSVLAPNAPL